MGIKGLTHLIDKHYPEVKKRVSIKELASAHRRVHQTDFVLLVIDGLSFVDPVYGDLDWACGGQWMQFGLKMEEFVSKFMEIGVKLVFIFDGTVAPDKLQTWIKRRNDNVRWIDEMFSNIAMAPNEDVKWDILGREKHIIAGRGGFAAMYLRHKCSCDVYFSFEDTDKEVASFAVNENACFGLMSNDSDFVIFDSKPYLSAKELDVNDMSTIVYDRDSLRKCLDIAQLSHLPLYACLMGNDVVTPEMLYKFHQKIGGRTWKNFVCRSKAVSLLLPELTSFTCDDLSFYVFGHKSYAEIFRNGLLSYTLSNSSALLKLHHNLPVALPHPHPRYILPDLWYKIAIACMKGVVTSDVYGVLRFKIYRAAETMECFDTYPACGSVFKEVRQRSYYVLFKHLVVADRNCVPSVVIEEWIAEPRRTIRHSTYVRPLLIDQSVNVPPLCELLFGDDDESKLKVFLSCFNITIKWMSSLQQIPSHLQLFGCIARFLFAHERLNLGHLEKQALIAQAVKVKSVEFLNRIVPVCDVQAISFGGFFARAQLYAYYVYAVCGQPLLSTGFASRCFDGKCYNFFYACLKSGSTVESLLNEDERIRFTLLMEHCNVGTSFSNSTLGLATEAYL